MKFREGGKEWECPQGTTYEEFVKTYLQKDTDSIALASANGKLRELMREVDEDADVTFLTIQSSAGHKAYVRTAIMMFMRAVFMLKKQEGVFVDKVKVEYAIGKGYFIRYQERTEAGEIIDSASYEKEACEEFAQKINECMREMVNQSLPIEKLTLPKAEAVALFEKMKMRDKVNLFKYRRGSQINVYRLGNTKAPENDYYDYFYGYMLPNTSYIKGFEVLHYAGVDGGYILNLPDQNDPLQVTPFKPKEKLFNTLFQATEWGDKMGISTVSDLNDAICSGEMSDLILVQEAFQERRIGEIAREIAEKEGVKFVMIAGPSSSGKTTFSHRLSIQLRTHGLKPHPIALDDYFVNREDTPLDENGDYNFECLGAIDVELFNQNMCALLRGEEVELPTFNFKTGHREYKGNVKKLGPDDILVIEGIHGLNEKMSYSLPEESKYKIYISALTSLNVDEHNRIPTTDGRLLRRMVRDYRTRGASAKRTIQMWPSVRRGEEENIFPFQEGADAFFNSALIYELAVIKQFAEPLLFSIGPEEPEYQEAKRLLKFLEYFLGISSEHLPNNSIVREFVGGSCFPV